ncbi:TPA: hypothetical protein IUT93_002163 [Enterococcus faecalis]|nr:hypothetical protein [Enterococcus faecalis]
MNIIPTKKALSLFSVFPASLHQNSDTERSFYSWHANYFVIDRKKILVLVNNKSFSPIVLANINAKNKKDLNNMIKAGIEEVFRYSGISSTQIKRYFLKAGRIEISSNYNRSIISINNNMIQLIECELEDIDFSTILQPEIMKFLANVPYRGLTPEFSFSTEIVKNEFTNFI